MARDMLENSAPQKKLKNHFKNFIFSCFNSKGKKGFFLFFHLNLNTFT